MSSSTAAAQKKMTDRILLPAKAWVNKNAPPAVTMAMPVSLRVQPLSANLPAMGAAIAPATPTRANTAISFWEAWK
ncbi:hypothetical protein D3C76_1788700 [compost metagenome]